MIRMRRNGEWHHMCVSMSHKHLEIGNEMKRARAHTLSRLFIRSRKWECKEILAVIRMEMTGALSSSYSNKHQHSNARTCISQRNPLIEITLFSLKCFAGTHEEEEQRRDAIRLENKASVNIYNYVNICINSSSSLWSTRSTFRVLAFISISFQTLFALDFRAAAALHREWRESERKAEQNKNTTIRKPYNDVAQMHACMIWHAKAPHQYNCMQNGEKTNGANEMEKMKKQNTTEELEQLQFLHDRWMSEHFSISTISTPNRYKLANRFDDYGLERQKKKYDLFSPSPPATPSPPLSFSVVGLLQDIFGKY